MTHEPPRASLANHWRLDPEIDFLNHGSFGACPVEVLDEQTRLRTCLERQPVEFLVRQYPRLLDDARTQLAQFLRADPEGLVSIPNSTTGVNAVLRSLEPSPGDELLTTDQSYAACRNALDFVADRFGAKVIVVPLPFPVYRPDEITDRLLGAVTSRTRIALIDHVTSPTGLVLPVEPIIRGLEKHGVETIIDGAHAPGMLDLNLDELRPSYYVGNCHKWLCTPKGAAFLWAREDLRESVRPVTIGHGAKERRAGRSRFHDEFDWTGTDDPTAFLCVPAALRVLGSFIDGGWNAIRRQNHELALRGREIVTQALGIAAPTPPDMIGSIAAIPLPDRPPGETLTSGEEPLQIALLNKHRIEVPVMRWPAAPRRLLRISAQLYNDSTQYERLAAALTHELSL